MMTRALSDDGFVCWLFDTLIFVHLPMVGLFLFFYFLMFKNKFYAASTPENRIFPSYESIRPNILIK